MVKVEPPELALAGAPALVFQPVVDLSSGRLLGMEALLRWSHPTRGAVSPGLVIPAAEANGDIVALGAWVLAEACERARHWSRSVQLAVNCTVAQLRRHEASAAVIAALERTGLGPDQLTIEVTENAIADPSAAADLTIISGLGVQLAVDDVGTNWSSFDPLKQLAINSVKIHESMIAALEPEQGINRLVVESVIRMAHSLGMATIIEGVERLDQVEIVRSFDADAGQGYFFARPMSAEDADAIAGSDPVAKFSLLEPGTMVPPPGGHRTGTGKVANGPPPDAAAPSSEPAPAAAGDPVVDAATSEDGPPPDDAPTEDPPSAEPAAGATKSRAGTSGRSRSSSTRKAQGTRKAATKRNSSGGGAVDRKSSPGANSSRGTDASKKPPAGSGGAGKGGAKR